MDKDDVPFVLLVCFVVGGWAGYGLASTFESRIEKDLWDIITSVGTMGAIAAALFVWDRGRREAKREKRARGLLMLVAYESPLGALREALGFMHEQLAKYDDQKMGDIEIYDLGIFAPVREPHASLLSVDVLNEIAGISDDVAHHLAFAFSGLRALRHELSEYMAGGLWVKLTREHREELMRHAAFKAFEIGFSVGHACHRIDEILPMEKRRLLRSSLDLYRRRKLGPPISEKQIGL